MAGKNSMKLVFSMWKLVSTSQLLSSSRSVSLKGQYWEPSCLLSMPVQLLTSLQAMVFSTTSMLATHSFASQCAPTMLATHSFASQCAPTTHPPDCPFLPHVLPTSDSGTRRTACSSTRTNQKHWSTDHPNSTPATRCDINHVTAADIDLPLANEMKVLGVVINQHLTFEEHASAVARSCNYHNQAIRHICHLLTTQCAQTLACCLILSRLDYCNTVLPGIPSANIQKQQSVQKSAARIVLQEPRWSHTKPLLH